MSDGAQVDRTAGTAHHVGGATRRAPAKPTGDAAGPASGASDGAAAARTRALAAASAIAIVLVTATIAPRRAREDARVACRAAEPWMAEALPGVGAANRDAALAAIRSGDLERLPPRARDDARAWFDIADPQPSSGIAATSAAQQRRTWRKTSAKPSSAP